MTKNTLFLILIMIYSIFILKKEGLNMKHSLVRKEYLFTPDYKSEAISLKTLIIENWWKNGCEQYFIFSKKCKTFIGCMATELGEVIVHYKYGQVSEEQIINKFRSTLDLLDYYLM